MGGSHRAYAAALRIGYPEYTDTDSKQNGSLESYHSIRWHASARTSGRHAAGAHITLARDQFELPYTLDCGTFRVPHYANIPGVP